MLVIQQTAVIPSSSISPSYLTNHHFYLAAEDPTGVEYHHINGTVARYTYNDETFDIRQYGIPHYTGHIQDKQHCNRILQWM